MTEYPSDMEAISYVENVYQTVKQTVVFHFTFSAGMLTEMHLKRFF